MIYSLDVILSSLLAAVKWTVWCLELSEGQKRGHSQYIYGCAGNTVCNTSVKHSECVWGALGTGYQVLFHLRQMRWQERSCQAVNSSYTSWNWCWFLSPTWPHGPGCSLVQLLLPKKQLVLIIMLEADALSVFPNFKSEKGQPWQQDTGNHVSFLVLMQTFCVTRGELIYLFICPLPACSIYLGCIAFCCTLWLMQWGLSFIWVFRCWGRTGELEQHFNRPCL